MKATDQKEVKAQYKSKAIETMFELIEPTSVGYIQGHIIEYASRHPDKKGAEDIKKIIQYCEKLLELEYGTESKKERLRKLNASKYRKGEGAVEPNTFRARRPKPRFTRL
jgi:hypothetical protein